MIKALQTKCKTHTMLAIVWRWRAGLRLGTNLPVTHLEHPSMSSHNTPDDNACMWLLWETYLAWFWQNIYPMEFESPLPHISGQSIYHLQADQPWVDPCDTGMQRGSFLELQYRESLRTRWAGRWFRESRGQAQFQKVSLFTPYMAVLWICDILMKLWPYHGNHQQLSHQWTENL